MNPEPIRPTKALLLDLDGTVYKGSSPIPGASETLRAAQKAGMRCLFITNRSNRPREVVRDQLRAQGIPCETEDVVTTAETTARYCRSGSAYVIGETGLLQACHEQGLVIADDSATATDWVIVSIDRTFTYQKLHTAMRLILRGAKFVATNIDARLLLDDGPVPGTGAIVSAVQFATGITPTLIGKPAPLLFTDALRQLAITPEEALAIGDNIHTDIAAGSAAGIPTALLRTGFSATEPSPATYTFNDWSELAAALRLD
ncbi:MAG: HAD-IIA family hydrolase [Kiritimatiellia bacterium]